MNTTTNILMVDDHPMIIEGYQNTILSSQKNNQEFKISVAHTIDKAISLIKTSKQISPFDILFIDIKIPPSSDGKINSGEDLAVYVKKELPEAKIIILTMFNETYRIHNIIKTIDPKGFLIKSDVTSIDLANAFQLILNGQNYYSHTVKKVISKSIIEDIYVDDKNRKILYLLSQGIKTKNLINHIDLSMSSIEKRKKYLKDIFNVKDGDDETLIKEARNKGFL